MTRSVETRDRSSRQSAFVRRGSKAAEAGNRPRLSPLEVAFLEALVREPTFEQVARRIGYSERQTRRLANRVVRRLGVINKYAAVAEAVRGGIIAPPEAGEIPRDFFALPDTGRVAGGTEPPKGSHP